MLAGMALSLSLAPSGAQGILSNDDVIAMVTARVHKDIIVDKIKNTSSTFRMDPEDLVALKKARVTDPIMEEMLLVTDDLSVIRNEGVITMHQGGVSRNIIIKRIQYSDNKFDLQTDAIIALKTAKVPDQIVSVMMNPKRAVKLSGNSNLIAGELPPHPQDLPVPARSRFQEPGIYYEEYTPKTNYLQLEPTTTNQRREGTVGEGITNQVTSGISGTTERIGLANPSANMVVKDNRPVFYFLFSGTTRKNQNEVGESLFEGVASPNDFVLIRAKVSGRGREIITGRSSAYSNESGFGPGAVPFRFKKISNQIYKVYFDEDVPAGEYAFLYNKGSEFWRNVKLFDFSLQNNTKNVK